MRAANLTAVRIVAVQVSRVDGRRVSHRRGGHRGGVLAHLDLGALNCAHSLEGTRRAPLSETSATFWMALARIRSRCGGVIVQV